MKKTTIVIRDFRQADLDAVVDIVKKSHEEPTNISLRSKQEFQKLLPEFSDFLVAEIDGIIAGLLTTFNQNSKYSSPWFDRTVRLAKLRNWKSYLYVDTCAVSENYRRKGIMLKLGDELIALHKNDYDAITFDTRYNPPNIPMLEFAKKGNFDKADEFKAPNGSTYAVFILKKKIK